MVDMVSYIYNLSYVGGHKKEDCSLRLALGKKP
jgi:hypothetical protein